MLLIIGILMVYLVGAGILTRISKDWTWKELFAYSFLIGIGLQSVFMFAIDVLTFQFNAIILFFANFAVLVFCYDSLYDYYTKKEIKLIPASFSLTTVNYTAFLLQAIIFIFVYIITQKNLFWPTTEYDAIGSYDKLGIAMALEGKIKISLFQYGLQGSGGLYPPLFHGAIAFLYLFDAVQPKIITTLFYISLLLGFYTTIRKFTTEIAALFFTLMLEMVPEMYSHAALLLGNIPTTAYTALGSIALFNYLVSNDKKYYWLSAILLSMMMWTRNDTLGFAFFAVLLLACFLYKEKRWKEVGIYAAIVWSPLIIWNLYLALKIKMSAGARFQLSHLFDFQKLKEMILFVVSYLSWYSPFGNNSGLELYGLAFLVPLIFAVFNYKKFKQDQPFIVFYILGSFAVYFLLFLLLDEKTQNASITNLMDSSFKRGLFCFMPLFIYYAANTSFSKKLFEKIEDFRLAKNV